MARAGSWFAACAWVAAGFYPGDNPDTFGHIALGRQILELGGVPELDSWSLFEPARAYRNYEWLADVLFAALYDQLGYSALTALKSVLVGSAVVLFGVLAYRLRGPRAELACAVALVGALPVARGRLSDRPHLFAFLFAALYLLGHVALGDAAKERRRSWLIAIPLIHVAWLNLHGSHLLGLGITAAFVMCAAQNRRVFLTLLGLEALASCVSPYGPAIAIEAVEHVFDPRYRALISEWQPWSEDTPAWMQLGPALYAALLAPFAPRLFAHGASERALLLIATALGVLAFRSQRFVADFVLILSPLLGAAYAPWLERVRFVPLCGATAIALATLSAAVPGTFLHLPPYAPFGFGESTLDRPAVAGTFLQANGEGARVFAMIADSWYLEFLAPGARFYIDGRVPFFGPEHVWTGVRMLSEPRLFERERRRFGLNAVIVRHTFAEHTPLLEHLERHPEFRLAAVELHHALYVAAPIAARADNALLEPLAPGFRSRFVLAAGREEQARIRSALTRLPRHANTEAYRAWVEALLLVAPLARGAIDQGLRLPANEREVIALRQALPGLRLASEATALPSVNALYGLVAALACELEESTRALSAAFRRSPSPVVLFALQELAIRSGEPEKVQTFLRSVPRGGPQDEWIRSLAHELEHAPRCAGLGEQTGS